MIEWQQYLDEKLHQFRVVANAQWDYLKFSDVCNWLDDNFNNDIEGRFYATKILLHTIYYSKKDIETLLNYGLNEKIYGEIVKNELIKNKNIYIGNSEASAMVEKLKEESFFIPLLDSDKPHESGNAIVADLVHKLKVQASQVDFHWNVSADILKKYKILVFVDDSIGSGNQLKKFYNSKKVEEIRLICEMYNIRTFFLALLAYDKSLKKLYQSDQLNGIEVIVCDVLTDRNRIFSEHNNMWENGERAHAIQYFEKIRKAKAVSFVGYKKLDFAVILHDRLPNWSLPIFWKDMPGWKYLLRRKSS